MQIHNVYRWDKNKYNKQSQMKKKLCRVYFTKHKHAKRQIIKKNFMKSTSPELWEIHKFMSLTLITAQINTQFSHNLNKYSMINE